MRRHDRALKYGYNPAQPRDEIGQWTDTGAGQRVRVAGGGSSGGGRGRYGDHFPGASQGQLIRLDLNVARTQNALEQIRQYDPNWQPKTTSLTAPGSIEGAIRNSEARAVEAEAGLSNLEAALAATLDRHSTRLCRDLRLVRQGHKHSMALPGLTPIEARTICRICLDGRLGLWTKGRWRSQKWTVNSILASIRKRLDIRPPTETMQTLRTVSGCLRPEDEKENLFFVASKRRMASTR
jgi:hypothetical protein